MKRLALKFMRYLFLLLVLFMTSCNSDTKKQSEEEMSISDVQLEVVDFDVLQEYLFAEDDNVYVVNFWATWCGPCVKELPHFERVNKEYSVDNVKVVLVNLDMPNVYDTKLKPFLKKHNLQSKHFVFDAKGDQHWMSKVDEKWSGAIPATLIYSKNKRRFYDKPFTYEQLKAEVNKFIL